MTPLPKKKHAKSRTRVRKSTKRFSMPSLVKCDSCGELKFPHKICMKCNKYKA